MDWEKPLYLDYANDLCQLCTTKKFSVDNHTPIDMTIVQSSGTDDPCTDYFYYFSRASAIHALSVSTLSPFESLSFQSFFFFNEN